MKPLHHSRLFLVLPALLLAAGCASVPTGPSAMVLPGTGKSFDQFRGDDLQCRQFASDAIGGHTADQAAADSVARSAALGTVLGATAGAAIGGHRGAGVGAGTGLLFGGLAGTGASEHSAGSLQRRYDNAYIQCMYALGHRVPVYGRMLSQGGNGSRTPPPPPPSGTRRPPPPPGAPPAPPPGE